MKFEKCIELGIVDALHKHWKFTKRFSDVKPEYLLTVSVADRLVGGTGNFEDMDREVRLEAKFRSVAFDIIGGSVGIAQYFRIGRPLVGSFKKIDIFVNSKKESCAIELKGLNTNATEVRKDLKRLQMLMTLNNSENRLDSAYFAFPSKFDRSNWARMLAKKVLDPGKIKYRVLARNFPTEEAPEDDIAEIFVICVSMSKV